MKSEIERRDECDWDFEEQIIPTDYELETHKWRQHSDVKEMGGGYCGSCSIEIHVSQMRDNTSWVHSSVGSWKREWIKDHSVNLLTKLKNIEYMEGWVEYAHTVPDTPRDMETAIYVHTEFILKSDLERVLNDY